MKIRSQSIIKLATIVLLMSAGYASLDHSAWAAKMYKWVDADGNISYQDKPPPTSGKLIEASELKSSSLNASPNTKNQKLTPVTVYTIAKCKGCVQLMAFLKQAEIPVVELSLQDREVQSRILRLSGKIAAPTLFIGDTLVNDLSEPGLITKLKGAGFTLPENIDPKTTTAEGSSTTSENSDSKTRATQEF